jgi:hypothetical protein
MSEIVTCQDQIVICQKKGKNKEYDCNSKVFVKWYQGQLSKFRCPNCLGLDIAEGTQIRALCYGICSQCECYFKCMEDYLGNKPKCPNCRNTAPVEIKPVNKNIVHSCCKCHTTNDVTLGPDLYKQVIKDDYTQVWKCGDCRHASKMRIEKFLV